MSSASFPPNDPTTPEGLAAAVKSLASNDHTANLSGIKAAIENAEAERKSRIVKALQGVADLETLKGSSAKRFALVYWHRNEAHTAYGTEYPVDRDDDGDPRGYSVYLDDYDHAVVATKYQTMKELREGLDSAKIPYTIAYFDK